MDESVPAAVAWLGMDFGQKEQAFDLTNARSQARKIVAAFFDGATFVNTTGLWQKTQNGGLTVMLYHPLFSSAESHKREVEEFFERARSCAAYLRQTYLQQAVALVAQSPNGATRVEFVDETHKVRDPASFGIPLSLRKYAQAAAGKARSMRLPGPTVQEPV